MESLLAKIIKQGFKLKNIKRSYQTSSPNILRMRRHNINSQSSYIKKLKFTQVPLLEHCYYQYIPKRSLEANSLIIWFHGGGYSLGPFKQNFKRLKQICDQTNSKGILLDYPKSPEHNYKDVFSFLNGFYKKILSHNKNFYFIGESAGGGLALGFTFKLKDENKSLPKKVFTFSPWLDLSMHINADKYESVDPFLAQEALSTFALNYAPKEQQQASYISPFWGDFNNLNVDIDIYSGTHEILHPTALALKNRYQNLKSLNFHFYDKMIHCWPLMPIKEAKIVMKEVELSINSIKNRSIS